VLVACSVEPQQALLELWDGEERRDRSIRLLGLNAVLHRTSLYGCGSASEAR